MIDHKYVGPRTIPARIAAAPSTCPFCGTAGYKPPGPCRQCGTSGWPDGEPPFFRNLWRWRRKSSADEPQPDVAVVDGVDDLEEDDDETADIDVELSASTLEYIGGEEYSGSD